MYSGTSKIIYTRGWPGSKAGLWGRENRKDAPQGIARREISGEDKSGNEPQKTISEVLVNDHWGGGERVGQWNLQCDLKKKDSRTRLIRVSTGPGSSRGHHHTVWNSDRRTFRARVLGVKKTDEDRIGVKRRQKGGAPKIQ